MCRGCAPRSTTRSPTCRNVTLPTSGTPTSGSTPPNRVHIPQRDALAGVGDVRGAEGGAPGLLRLEVAPSERARLAQRGACHRDIPAQGRGSEHLRRAQDARAAALAHDAHLAQARGPHHARARMARSHARASSVPRSTNAPPRGSPQTTWSSAGSRPAAQTRRGSRTSPTSKPARAGCIWRS